MHRTLGSQTFLIAAVLAGVACGESATGPGTDPPAGGARFEIEVSGERFLVDVTEARAIAGLEARMKARGRGVVIGRLLAGNGGFNSPWSWHLDPATVEAADVAIEVCDGRPSMVEADLAYWLGTVRIFCPWGAAVVRRLR